MRPLAVQQTTLSPGIPMTRLIRCPGVLLVGSPMNSSALSQRSRVGGILLEPTAGVGEDDDVTPMELGDLLRRRPDHLPTACSPSTGKG